MYNTGDTIRQDAKTDSGTKILKAKFFLNSKAPYKALTVDR